MSRIDARCSEHLRIFEKRDQSRSPFKQIKTEQTGTWSVLIENRAPDFLAFFFKGEKLRKAKVVRSWKS